MHPIEPEIELHPTTRGLLSTLTATGRAVQLAGLQGGLTDLMSQWDRHVEDMESRLFPCLVAGGPAADGPVGFCLGEHAALNARLRDLAAAPPTRQWIREAELLISRLIQHLFLEARLLRPLLDRMGSGELMDRSSMHAQGRG
ncbi:MAG TPA: hemerythrin domain-containing protein [Candidatus Methylomirabilis sp.]|nr:hemerythrin domain-containing protein [Candidatus Methylomirabilis sp.]